MGSCASLNDASRSGYAASHDRLVRAVAKALECTSIQHCRRSVTEYVLRPMIERHLKERKPYIRLGNLVVVVEAPGGDFDAGGSRFATSAQTASCGGQKRGLCLSRLGWLRD